MKPFDPRLLRYSRSSRGFILLSVLLALLHAIATIAQGYVLTRLIIGLFQEERKLTQFGPQVFTLFEIFLAPPYLMGPLKSPKKNLGGVCRNS